MLTLDSGWGAERYAWVETALGRVGRPGDGAQMAREAVNLRTRSSAV